jgi:hypothetical protein
MHIPPCNVALISRTAACMHIVRVRLQQYPQSAYTMIDAVHPPYRYSMSTACVHATCRKRQQLPLQCATPQSAIDCMYVPHCRRKTSIQLSLIATMVRRLERLACIMQTVQLHHATSIHDLLARHDLLDSSTDTWQVVQGKQAATAASSTPLC